MKCSKICECLWDYTKLILILIVLIILSPILIFVPCCCPIQKPIMFILKTLGCRTTTRILKVFLSGEIICYRKIKKKAISLTIDDAPSRNPALFLELLDILKFKNLKVTFFIISSHLKYYKGKNQAILNRIIEDGHEVANHMVRDKSYFKSNLKDFKKDLETCENALKFFKNNINYPKLYKKNKFFRAPNGLTSKIMAKELKKQDFKNLLVDIYSFDPDLKDWKYILNFSCKNVQRGSIVVLHCPENNVRKNNLEVIPRFIDYVRRKGYEIVTASELEDFYDKEYCLCEDKENFL